MNPLDQNFWPKCPLCGLKQPRGGFRCPYCPEQENISFCYNIQLMVHLRDIHKIRVPQSIPCEMCPEVFDDTDSLLEHILIDEHSCTSEHLTCFCQVCFQFDTEDNLKRHQASHQPSPNVPASGYTPPQFPRIPEAPIPRPWLHPPPVHLPGHPHSVGVTLRPNNNSPHPMLHVNVNTSFYPPHSVQPQYPPPQPVGFAPRPFTNATQKFIPEEKDRIEEFNNAAKALIRQQAACTKSGRQCNICKTMFAFENLVNLLKCIRCEQYFKTSSSAQKSDIVFHDVDCHGSESPWHKQPVVTCPEKSCEFPGGSKVTCAEMVDHYKKTHSTNECLYHYICPRPYCRGVFGTLQGMYAHEIVCKSINASAAQMKSQRVCSKASCTTAVCSWGLVKCTECNLVLSNEKELDYHLQQYHKKPAVAFKLSEKSELFSCAYHFVCIESNVCEFFSPDVNCLFEHESKTHLNLSKKSLVAELNKKNLSELPDRVHQQLEAMREKLKRHREKLESSKLNKREARSSDVENKRAKVEESSESPPRICVKAEPINLEVESPEQNAIEPQSGLRTDLTSLSRELMSNEQRALIDNPASSAAWDNIMDSLELYTNSLDY